MAENYNPTYFSNVLEQLPESFFIQGEFPLSRDRDQVFATAALLNDPNFDRASLTGTQLEDLIFCLVYSPNKSIAEILAERVTSRLMGLLWAFFQYNYKNDNILETLRAIEKKHTKADFEQNQGQIIFEKGFLGDPITLPVVLVIKGRGKFADLISTYEILQDSPYFRDVLTKFFIQAPPTLIKENFEYLTKLFESGPIPVMALIRYIDVIMPEEFSPEATQLIVEKLGFPGKSDFWLDYPQGMAQKIIDWNKIYKISTSYSKGSRKFKFLSKYAHKIKDTALDEDTGILRIMFGQFCVLDDLKDDSVLIFCANPSAAMEVRELRRLIIQYSAKDYIVKGTQAEYMHINLSGLDKMYADELFDVLLDM